MLTCLYPHAFCTNARSLDQACRISLGLIYTALDPITDDIEPRGFGNKQYHAH